MVKDNCTSKKSVTSTCDKTSVPINETHNMPVKETTMNSDETTIMRIRGNYAAANSQIGDTPINFPKTHKRRKNMNRSKSSGLKKPKRSHSRTSQKRAESKRFSYMDGVLTGVLIGSIGATILGFPH